MRKSPRNLGLFVMTAVLVGCVGLLLAPVTNAQQSTATISGVVTDSAGAVIAGATVRVRNIDTGAERVVTSDSEGRYSAPSLSLGRYAVTVERAGFQTVKREGLDLSVGQEVVINIELPTGNVSEQVTITTQAPVIDTTTASVSTLVDSRFVRELPLNGRNLLSLTLLSPGVSLFTNKANTTNNDIGIQISVVGVSKRSNLFLLDGTTVNNLLGLAGGATEAFLGVEAMREFRTLTTSYDAQYGRAAGGIVTIVSRAGTNSYHGAAFEFHRNDNLDARNFFDRCPNTNPKCKSGGRPEFKRNQFGGAIGGPIIRDKTFFFGTAEFLREQLGLTQVTKVPDELTRQGLLRTPTGIQNIGIAASVAPYLNLFPLPNGQIFGDGLAEFSFPSNQVAHANFFQIRVDHRLNDKNSLFGRYTFDDSRLVKPLDYPQFSVIFPYRNQFLTLDYTCVISPSLVSTARFGYARTNVDQFYTDTVEPALRFSASALQFGRLAIGGLPVFGGTQPNRIFDVRNEFDFSDDVVYTRGRHAVKFGGIFSRLQDNEFVPSFRDGQFIFGSIRSFMLGQPAVFISNTPGSADDRAMRNSYLGLYIQDGLKLRSNLTLNLGLRYDFATPVKDRYGRQSVFDTLNPFTATKTVAMGTLTGTPYKNPTKKNFAPRVGLVWDPFGDGKTAVRAGFGVFYDIILAGFVTRTGIVNPPFNSTLQVIRPTFPRPSLAAGQGIPIAAVSEFDINQPHVLKWNLGVERELFWNVSVSATYIGTRGINLIRSGGVNTPIPQITPEGRLAFFGPKRNPNFGSIDYARADGDSHYHALQFNVQKRFGQGLEFLSAYTFSRTIDNTQGLSASNEEIGQVPQVWVPTDNRVDRGLASFHRKHIYNFSFTYDLPLGKHSSGLAKTLLEGWQSTGILSMASGLPFTPGIQTNRSNTGTGFTAVAGLDRPDWAPGRNPQNAILGGPNQYFDPAAFALPPVGVIGNVGRNVLIGPNVKTLDMGVIKSTPLRFLGEAGALQLRVEAFNILNRANFGLPDKIVFGGSQPTEAPLSSAGRIRNTSTSSRQIQLGLKLVF